jgi:Protein of unknown function (DUF1326)
MLAWHIREGHYGTVRFDGLNLLALSEFEANLGMDDDVKARVGFFIDERADARQREALQIIFTPEDDRPGESSRDRDRHYRHDGRASNARCSDAADDRYFGASLPPAAVRMRSAEAFASRTILSTS